MHGRRVISFAAISYALAPRREQWLQLVLVEHRVCNYEPNE